MGSHFVLQLTFLGAVVILSASGSFSPTSANDNYSVHLESRIANFTPIASADGKTYFAEQTTKMNWSQALSHCNSSGMRLATVKSEQQRNVLANAVWVIPNAYWTAGRDSQTPSQFSWEFGRETLHTDFAVFGGYDPVSTCVAYSTMFNSLWSNPCYRNNFPLCEFLHGK